MADVKAYAETLLKTAKGVTDDQKAAFLAVLADPEVSKSFDETLTKHMNKVDYDREIGRVNKTKDDQQLWYDKQLVITAKNQEVVDAAQSEVKRYIETYGTLPDGTQAKGTPTAAAADFISKTDLTKMLEERDRQTINLMKGVGKITADHITRFKEKPDLDEIERIAIEQKLPLELAYERYIAPKVSANQTADFDARIKAAKEEGLKEGLSRSGIPVDTKPKSPHPFYDSYLKNTDKGAAKVDNFQTFTTAWNEAQTATK